MRSARFDPSYARFLGARCPAHREHKRRASIARGGVRPRRRLGMRLFTAADTHGKTAGCVFLDGSVRCGRPCRCNRHPPFLNVCTARRFRYGKVRPAASRNVGLPQLLQEPVWIIGTQCLRERIHALLKRRFGAAGFLRCGALRGVHRIEQLRFCRAERVLIGRRGLVVRWCALCGGGLELQVGIDALDQLIQCRLAGQGGRAIGVGKTGCQHCHSSVGGWPQSSDGNGRSRLRKTAESLRRPLVPGLHPATTMLQAHIRFRTQNMYTKNAWDC